MLLLHPGQTKSAGASTPLGLTLQLLVCGQLQSLLLGMVELLLLEQQSPCCLQPIASWLLQKEEKNGELGSMKFCENFGDTDAVQTTCVNTGNCETGHFV